MAWYRNESSSSVSTLHITPRGCLACLRRLPPSCLMSHGFAASPQTLTIFESCSARQPLTPPASPCTTLFESRSPKPLTETSLSYSSSPQRSSRSPTAYWLVSLPRCETQLETVSRVFHTHTNDGHHVLSCYVHNIAFAEAYLLGVAEKGSGMVG